MKQQDFDKNLLKKREYWEASQEKANQENKRLIDTLSEQDKKRFEAVTQALKILTEADADAYLFVDLPVPTYDKKIDRCFRQYNNCGRHIKWESNDTKSIDSRVEEMKRQMSLSYGIMFSWAMTAGHETIFEAAQNVAYLARDYYVWKTTGELPEYIKRVIDESSGNR